MEAAELGESSLEGSLLDGFEAEEALEASFGFGVEEGVGVSTEELVFPLSETAELPGGGEEVGEELVFQRGLGPDGTEEIVAKLFERLLVGFGYVEGGAVKSAFEIDDGWRRRGRRHLMRLLIVVVTATSAHVITPSSTVPRRVKRFWRFGGQKCKIAGDFYLSRVVNGVGGLIGFVGMNRRNFVGSAAGALVAPARKRPNIVVVLADDMGWSDLGCYGSEIRTPNLDGLAQRGVRFTQFYNTARCCPTRASLLTGLYPHQTGIGHMINPRPLPGYQEDSNRRCVTMAEALEPAGYQTMMCGKWHVARDVHKPGNWPLQRGFDKYYGIITGATNYFDPVTLVRDNAVVAAEGDGYYLTDALSDQAEPYVGDAVKRADPFLLYLAYTSPHRPLHAPEANIARCQGRYGMGWDELRSERHRR